MKIRRTTILDIPIIQDIAHKAWPVAFASILSEEQIAYMLNWMYSEEGLERQIWIQNQLFAIAELEDKPVGFVGFEHNFKKTSATKIQKLYLLPDYIGKGVGKGLLDYVQDKALDLGHDTLVLNVNKFNSSIDFYKKNGFEITSEEVIEIGKGFVMDDYVMTKKL